MRWRTAKPRILLPQARHAEQSHQFHSIPQLCRASSLRSVSHRVLGARRSQTSAYARRSGIQPQDCVGDRRKRAESAGKLRCYSGGGARMWWSRISISRAPARWLMKLERFSATEFVCATSVDLSSAHRCQKQWSSQSRNSAGIDIIVNTAAIYSVAAPTENFPTRSGPDFPGQRNRQLSSRSQNRLGVQDQNLPSHHGSNEFSQRRCPEEGQRSFTTPARPL